MNNVWAVSTVVMREMYRRKDFYVLLILTVLITLILGSVNFFNESNVVRYLKEVCLLLIWIASLVIAITTAARQIPAERESRTIFPLLAKPISRAEVLIGKFLGCWLASGVALVCFYLFFGVISAAREHGLPIGGYLQAVMLHWFMLAVVIALALLGSLVFAAPSSNNTICFVVVGGILLIGRHLHKIAIGKGGFSEAILTAVYYVIPQLGWFDVRERIVHDWPAIDALSFLVALAYALAYAAVLLFIACWIFRRKRLQ
jgi:ABC-type transport system involved in multi-copper enzyme maturation permease subunit